MRIILVFRQLHKFLFFFPFLYMRSFELDKDLKLFFEYKKTDRLWHIPAIAAMSVAIPFFVAYFLGYGADGIQASIGGLVSLYIHPGNIKRRMKVLLLTAIGFIISYTVGLVFSFDPYISAVAIAIFAMLVHLLTSKFRLPPPGNFFFIMVASIGCFLPSEPSMILPRVGILAIGAFWACFLGFLYAVYITRRFPHQQKVKTPYKRKYHFRVESVLIGLTIGCSILVSHWLALPNPYWVPISCLAVIQGINQRFVWHRTLQRIGGTTIGILIAWLLLSFNTHPLFLGLWIMIFQYFIEYFIVRNYGLAVVFITPMTIFLAETGNFSEIATTDLMFYRMYDIAVGAIIGAIGGSLIHSNSIYTRTRLYLMQVKRMFLKNRVNS